MRSVNCILFDGWMREIKPGHSESLMIDNPEGLQPHVEKKKKPIWITLESDPEVPYKTRQIKCYIASNKEGVGRRQVFGGPNEIETEMKREINKQAKPVSDGLKEIFETLGESFTFKMPDQKPIFTPPWKETENSLKDCQRLWDEGKQQQCIMTMKKLCESRDSILLYIEYAYYLKMAG